MERLADLNDVLNSDPETATDTEDGTETTTDDTSAWAILKARNSRTLFEKSGPAF